MKYIFIAALVVLLYLEYSKPATTPKTPTASAFANGQVAAYSAAYYASLNH